MSRENVELVRRLQPGPDVDLVQLFRDETTSRAVFQAVAPFFHPDFEVVVPTGVQAGPGGPPMIGMQGLRQGWLDWLEPWETYRVEIEDLIDVGDRVVVLVSDYGRRGDVDAEVSVSGAAVYTVREGKGCSRRVYLDRKQALEAVGLRE